MLDIQPNKNNPKSMAFKSKILFLLCLATVGFAQNANAQTNLQVLSWDIDENVSQNTELGISQILSPYKCNECFANNTSNYEYSIPYTSTSINLTKETVLSVGIKNVKSSVANSNRLHQYILNDYNLKQLTTTENGTQYLNIILTPIRKNGDRTEYITSFEWDIRTTPAALSRIQTQKTKRDQTYESVLASGDFHKVKIVNDGVYKIDANYMSAIGADLNTLKMSDFRIYGNGGNMLPEIIATDRTEDLQENALLAVDNNGNNKLDAGDYFLWYATGPTRFFYQNTTKTYSAEGHDFDVAAYYYLNWDKGPGKRITTKTSGQNLSVNSTVTDYDHLIYHEENAENHIKSGRRWWGDKMQITTTKTFDYNVSGVQPGKKILLNTVTMARSTSGFSSSMRISLNDSIAASVGYNAVRGDYDDSFGTPPILTTRSRIASGNNINLRYNYLKTQNEAAAWIDYFVLTVPRKLGVFEQQQIVRTQSKNIAGNVKYAVSPYSSEYQIWDINTTNTPSIQSTYVDGSGVAFTAENVTANNTPEYILFNPTTCSTPVYVEKVENQNLHAVKNIDYLIVTHSDLLEEATKLADFHRENGLTVEVFTAKQIFNEFSSGSQDLTGIRDFAKLLYDRGQLAGAERTFKHILLFGDASYDYKDVETNNTNVVPTYQSFESNFPPSSYCSDDYYAILDDNEGYWGIDDRDEALDIGVGRLPASNAGEAAVLVDKILHYHSATSRGNWIQTITFLGDDEDDNRHVGPSETMTQGIKLESPEWNIKKIWMDAYEQVSFGSGNKYPQVNSEVTKMIGSQGTLIFNYVGHGGENGMAHERVVTRPEILAWSNYDKLSFYITASCELAKIDNLDIESPGELMLLDPDGGAVGMLATTRVVYIGQNTQLNTQLVNGNLLRAQNGKIPTLGDAYKTMRNADNNESTNKRCFILLADPAMSLLYPEHRVVTTAVNNVAVGLFTDTASNDHDTLNALELTTIEGEIRDKSNQILTDFNGEVFPTFYDKPSTYKTLGQDPDSYPFEFQEQNRIIYKGVVSATNGKFKFQFVVPKDIAYNIGYGKLSYYAKDGLEHAGGTELNYLIGGTSDSSLVDNQFDELELFIDDESWVFGGNTSFTPLLLARLSDSNGINTIGSGIGREMIAILDKGTDAEKTIVLNDYYKPELNSYQAGRIEYPFEELPAGRHTLSLKVWDVYNNSAEAYTEFVIADQEGVSVENLLNYPNPFTTFTSFHFDHNKSGQNLVVNLSIMSVTGKVIKNITQDILNAPAHSQAITWDGRDEYGDPLGRGVYLYTLKVKAEDGTTESKTEKLYIIK